MSYFDALVHKHLEEIARQSGDVSLQKAGDIYLKG
jgi:hypothetical protein